ncbi:MAG TPA: DUF6671 family protein [Acidimicrobiales bacterium]
MGLDVVVAEVDTDLLGTFSGEIPRPGNPLETARRKAQWAIDDRGTRIGLASEGSFGPHPDVPYVAIGVELAICLDDLDGLEIVERVIGTDTNFQHLEVVQLPLPPTFLESTRFPSHALVVSPLGETTPMFKGLVDLEEVDHAIACCLDRTGRALVQTDMRAHLNPTRQRALSELAERLARRVATLCPACTSPGWGVVAVETGLPCERCAQPTPLVAYDVSGCARAGCDERTRDPRVEVAPAGQCPACNP